MCSSGFLWFVVVALQAWRWAPARGAGVSRHFGDLSLFLETDCCPSLLAFGFLSRSTGCRRDAREVVACSPAKQSAIFLACINWSGSQVFADPWPESVTQGSDFEETHVRTFCAGGVATVVWPFWLTSDRHAVFAGRTQRPLSPRALFTPGSQSVILAGGKGVAT